MAVIQDRTRLEIRESIGRAMGAIIGVATGGGDTSSLIDELRLAGGDDEHIGKFVQINSATNITAGDQSRVSDYSGSGHDATCSPVFDGAVAAGDTYEMWPEHFDPDEINDMIERAASDVARLNLKPKKATGKFTLSNVYEYAFLSGFETLHMVEYVANVGIEHDIHLCEYAWDELVDGDVTASADSTYNVEGSACLKLVVAAGCGAGDILATENITSLDITDCDQVEIFIRSSVALDAGDLQLLLDNTAQCASPVETINIPATTANTDTHHVLTLANPQSDSAIVSVGIKMVTDKGAFTLYVDRIKAVKSTSREYRELNPQYWDIVKDTTNYLKLTPSGMSVVGNNNNLRLSGLQLPDIMDADTDTSDIDSEYIIEFCLGYIMLNHSFKESLDIENLDEKGKAHMAMAEIKKKKMSNNYPNNTRLIGA